MNKVLFLTFALGVLAVGAMAQGKASFAGTWNLDAAKSKIEGPTRGGLTTLTVTQTAKELTVTTATKRPDLPSNAPAGPGGGMGRGLGMGGNGTVTYSLENKTTIVEVDGPTGKAPIAYNANKEADGSLKLSSKQVFQRPGGHDLTVTRNETWKLSADGKTLTIEREQSGSNGSRTSTHVFEKAAI
jgi:hypothetical protein